MRKTISKIIDIVVKYGFINLLNPHHKTAQMNTPRRRD